MHQNAFGGRAPPGPAGGAIALPQPLSGEGRGGKGGERKGREGKGRGGKGRKGRGRGGRGRGMKGEGKREREVALEPPSKKSGYGPE